MVYCNEVMSTSLYEKNIYIKINKYKIFFEHLLVGGVVGMYFVESPGVRAVDCRDYYYFYCREPGNESPGARRLCFIFQISVFRKKIKRKNIKKKKIRIGRRKKPARV